MKKLKVFILGVFLLLGISCFSQVPFGKTYNIPFITYMKGDSMVKMTEAENTYVSFQDRNAIFKTDNGILVIRLDSLVSVLHPRSYLTYYAYAAYNITLKSPCKMAFMWSEDSFDSMGIIYGDDYIILLIGEEVDDKL